MKKIINYAIWCVVFTIFAVIFAIQEKYLFMAIEILIVFMNFCFMCDAIKDYKIKQYLEFFNELDKLKPKDHN